MLNFGMRGHDFETNTIEDLIEKCKKHSVSYIQLVLKKSIFDFKEGAFSEDYATKIGNAFKKAGIKIPVLGCYINPSETDKEQLQKNLNYFIENLNYAKFIGADTVGLETGFVGKEIDVEKNNTEEAYQYLLKNMRVLCKKAEELGVKIAIEGVHCFVINTPKKLKRLLNDLNSENVGVIFDPVNYLNYDNYKNQNDIFNEFIELLADKTMVIHLKDFKIQDNKAKYEYPCKGLLNKSLVFEIIKKYNAEIPIILEEVKENKLDEVRSDVLNLYNELH